MTDRTTTQDVPLTNDELETIMLALKLGKIRYGMLLQLAAKSERTVLEFDTIGGLIDSLRVIVNARPAINST
jgi:hypothetical protein